MSVEAAPETNVPVSTEPRSMPATASSEPAAPADSAYDPSADLAAGLAAYRAASAPPSEAPATSSEVVAAAVADATGTTAPAAAPPPPTAAPAEDLSDAKLNRVFTRIAALEKERDDARAASSRLEQQAARAVELEAKLAKLKNAPVEFLRDEGWTQDTLAEFVLKGEGAVSPQLTAQDRKIAELEKRLEERERASQAEAYQRQVREFQGTIPSQLAEHKATLPHLSTYFDSDAEMADSVWNVIRAAYQQQKTELTVVEAAQAVEKVLADQAKRFTRASSKSPASSNTAPAPKPTQPTLTNQATTAPAPQPSAAADDISPNYAAAAELLRSLRTK